MNRHHVIAGTLLILLPVLAACQPASTPTDAATTAPASSAPRTALGRTVEKAMDEARKEMATENIGISGDMDIRLGSNAHVSRRTPRDAQGNPLPKAEISPAGDLLIDGKAVQVDAEQRALLLEYREHVLGIAEVGMVLGAKGADLGMHAAGEALKSVFTGQTAEFEQRIEAEAAQLEAEAMRLCDRLPGMMTTQRELAEALPAFRPYATMTAEDIEDCRDGRDGSHARRDGIQEDIRASIRSATRAAGTAGADGTHAKDEAAEAANAATPTN